MQFCQVCGQPVRGGKPFSKHNWLNHKRIIRKKNRCKVCASVLPTVTELQDHQLEKHPLIHREALLRLPPPPPPRVVVEPTEDGNLIYHGVTIKVLDNSYQCDLCPNKGPYKSKRKAIDHIRDNHIGNNIMNIHSVSSV